MVLKSIHASVGVTLEQLRAEVSWDLKEAADLTETTPPTGEELNILREKVDPSHIWVGGKRQRPPIN